MDSLRYLENTLEKDTSEASIGAGEAQETYDDIVRLAAFICSTPFAAVSVLDGPALRVLSSVGLEGEPRLAGEPLYASAFCAETAAASQMTVIYDAQADVRFAAEPLVTGRAGVRFYAGVPLVSRQGRALGVLCVMDRTLRGLTAMQQAALQSLGRHLSAQIEAAQREESRRRGAEENAARLTEYNRLLLESTAEGIYGMDTTGRCTFINKAASRMLGYTVEEVQSRSMHDVIHHSHTDGRHYPVEECPIYRAFRAGQPCHSNTEVFWRKDGASFPVAYSSYPIIDAGTLLGAVITFSDITERRRVEQEKEALLAEAQARADLDPLTNLLNHRAFHTRLAAEAARAERENTMLGLVMLDLDNFKFFNDVYGHTIGDDVLRLVAGRLRETCRSYDTIARFGGDEFALLLPDVGRTTRDEIEARLREALGGLFYQLSEQETIPVGVSLGMAQFSGAGGDCVDMLRQADERLRWSKTGGAAEENARRVRADIGSRVAGFGMMDALVTAVDNKDRYTRRHSEDVMEYSLHIARQLGLSEKEQRTIGAAALLHDVGEIGVPDAVLRKPSRLTEQEFEAVKQHPMMGAVIVGAVPGLEGILDAVRHHHERWDGAGYPFGLIGEETPLTARLMSVADAYSAMTTDRPYRKGMGQAKARAILEAGAGTQWDPACVRAFLDAPKAAANGLSESLSATIPHEAVSD